MKVAYENSFYYSMLARIDSMPDDVIVRAEMADLGDPRQISRAFKALTEKGILVKLGYGVYAKLAKSRFSDTLYLKGSFIAVMRTALSKLNIKWESSQEEQDYNAGRSTQVPINPYTRLKTRFRRKLKYRTMELKVG